MLHFRSNDSFTAQSSARLALAALLSVSLGLASCHRPGSTSAGSSETPASSATPGKSSIARAAWYDVPEKSLAHRRAGPNELTAAHDSLPLGTLLRVTDLKNSKSVVVRITDRGIHRGRVKLDLCREAAEQLGMISDGFERVRMEILPAPEGMPPPESGTTAAHP